MLQRREAFFRGGLLGEDERFDDHRQRRVQDLRNDGLARGVSCRAQGRGESDRLFPKPRHLERVFHFAIRDDRSVGFSRSGRGENGQRLCFAARKDACLD